MKNKFFKPLILIAICVLLIVFCGLFMRTQLDVDTVENVESTVKSLSTKFDNPREGSITGTAERGSITLTDTTITVSDVVLKAPGDTVTWMWDAQNVGNIDAKISNFTLLDPKVELGNSVSDDSNYYTYDITYSDGTAIKKNDALPVNGTREMKIVISYVGDNDGESVGNIHVSQLGATLLYERAV